MPVLKQKINTATSCEKNSLNFQYIDNGNYDEARNLTVFNLLNISPSHIEAGNVLGYADNFLKTIKEFVIIIQHIKCPNNCAISGRMEYNPMVDSRYRYPTEFINAVNATTQNECVSCPLPKPKISTSYSWKEGGPPPFFVYSINFDETVSRGPKKPRKLQLMCR